MSLHIGQTDTLYHPLHPLSASEIEDVVSIVRREHGQVYFNTVTLLEPPKSELLEWLSNPEGAQKPHRQADVVVISPQWKLYDGHVSLTDGRIISWEHTPDIQRLITMEDLRLAEDFVRKEVTLGPLVMTKDLGLHEDCNKP